MAKDETTKIIRLNSESEDDQKLYRIPTRVWEQIKTITTSENEEYPDEVNKILDEYLVPANEVKPDGDIVTAGDCYGCFEGERLQIGGGDTMTKQELIKAIRHNLCADRGEDLQEAYDYITEVLQSEGVSFIVTFTVLGVLLNTVANCVEKLDTEKVHA